MELANERMQREATELPIQDQGQEETGTVTGTDGGPVEPRALENGEMVRDEVVPRAIEPVQTPAPQSLIDGRTEEFLLQVPPNLVTPNSRINQSRSSPEGARPTDPRQDQQHQPRQVTPHVQESPSRTVQSVPGQSVMATPAPLFSEDQLQQMAAYQQQAAWLYHRHGEQMPQVYPMHTGSTPVHVVSSPVPQVHQVPQVLQRPLFLEQDEARLSEERKRFEETRKQMEKLIGENQRLSKRVEELESKTLEAEHQFSTPDQAEVKRSGSQVEAKEAETPKGPPTVLRPQGSQQEAEIPIQERLKEAAVSVQVPEVQVQVEAKEAETTTCPTTFRPEGSEGRSKSQSSKEAADPQRRSNFEDKQMEFMYLVVESMRQMQTKMNEVREDGVVRGIEVVRSGLTELPTLPQWSAAQGPLQLGDWLLLVEPIISDLSATSESWWKEMVKQTEDWYSQHLSLSPLDKLQHEARQPLTLAEPKWQKLERRVASMMLQAVPEGIREDLVSARKMSVFAILTHLQLVYAPGGITEKQTLLKSLEDPQEIANINEAPAALRRWMRWKQRTLEVGATMPDPALQMKGLNKLMKKILESHKDLQFRVSLARNTLGVDVMPSTLSVGQFATHLLAEVEQLAMSDKRSLGGASKVDATKLKSMEVEAGEKGKGKGRDRPEEEKSKCRFFLTDSGCRKGKECKFSHDLKDDRRRCYTCGAVDHLSPACPRKSSQDSPKKAKGLQVEGEKEKNVSSPVDSSSSSESPGMKELLEEAARALKSLNGDASTSPSSSASVKEDTEEGKKEVLEKLNAHLKTLSLKVLRLNRLSRGARQGLVDSGATHPLRPKYQWEDVTGHKVVDVTMANGSVEKLRISPSGSMIASHYDIEPIVPMGQLIEKLGCTVQWLPQGASIWHPKRGELPVKTGEGCPQLSRSLVLSLIQELEEKNTEIQMNKLDFNEELDWMKQLIAKHPVLQKLPEEIREGLAVAPGSWSDLPGNKRQRKRWRREGFVVHLYAGEKEGFTLGRAWQQQGGDSSLLMEVDVKRSSSHDMVKSGGIYADLLRTALDGKLRGLVGGPNCRTRSILRHIPIPGQEDCPRPIRRWGGEEDGIKDATQEEKQKIYEDDLLLWRMWFLFLVSSYVRKVMGYETPAAMAMEHPASPKEWKPEVVSWWDLEAWKSLRREFGLEEVTFNQKDLGGKVSKRTTFGTNMEMEVYENRMKSQEKDEVKSSKELARWAPGVMSMVAKALLKFVFDQRPSLKVLSWDEHVAFGHIPYRRDCLVCQQTLQQGFPHRKTKFPVGGSLSLDTAGPLVRGKDVDTKNAKFFLVGALTWSVPKGTSKFKEEEKKEEDLVDAPIIEESGDARHADEEHARVHPQIAEGGDARHAEEQRARVHPQPEDSGDARLVGDGQRGGMHPLEGGSDARLVDDNLRGGMHLSEGDQDQGRGGDGPKEGGPEDFETRTFRIAIPMVTKHGKVVAETAMQMVMQLKMDGFHIQRIHTDRGHEFAKTFQSWAKHRGIHCSMTAGDEPQQNGRAEVAVKVLKTQVRRLLCAAGVDATYWPLALRHANALSRCFRQDTVPKWPTFLQEVLVRKRRWKRDDFSPTYEVVKYVAPSPEDHGHWIIGEEGTVRLTRCYLKKGTEVPTEEQWIALEKETIDTLTSRRRIREKSSVRAYEVGIDDDVEEVKRRKEELHRILEEEVKHMLEDEEETLEAQVQVITSLRKMINSEENEEEEVLQTRVVSPKEVLKDWPKWKGAAENEVQSLLHEKEAFKSISKDQLETMIRQADAEGKKVEFLPSKLVWTKKAGKNGGKAKCRWVICGNFEQKKEGENNFSSGADASALRVAIVICAKNQWQAGTLDVKTAILNAMFEDSSEETSLIVINPPHFLVERGCLEKGVCYLPLRAVYGLRRSPKLWGESRDRVIAALKVELEEEGKKVVLKFIPLLSEANLWRICEEKGEDEDEDSGPLRGLLMTYVDDMFVCGNQSVLDSVMSALRSQWTTTDPDKVCEDPIKFLGIEISKRYDQEKGRDVWHLSQESYLKDLIEKESTDVKMRKMPISRDLSSFPTEPEENLTEEKIKLAQKQVGELLWLVTRTRPELSYAVSRMGSYVSRHPTQVSKIFDHVMGYLKGSIDDGISFNVDPDGLWRLDCFTDSSFAPEGAESHGAFVIQLCGCCVFWRSGRQSFTTTSTAESELVEVVEGMIGGESVVVILEEIVGGIPRFAWCDNQASVLILTQDGGSWRTRHLKIRAHAAKSAIDEGRWILSHKPGERLIADIATKPLASVRFEMLKFEMGMRSRSKEEGKDSSDARLVDTCQRGGMHLLPPHSDAPLSQGSGVHLLGDGQKKEKLLKVVTIAALVVAAKGQEDDEEDWENITVIDLDFMVIYSFVIVALTMLVQWMWKVGVRLYGRGWSNQSLDQDRSHPAEAEVPQVPLVKVRRSEKKRRKKKGFKNQKKAVHLNLLRYHKKKDQGMKTLKLKKVKKN